MAYADSKKASFVLSVLSAVGRPLSDGLPAVVAPLKAGAYDIPCRAVIIQPLAANTGVIYVSIGDPNVSSTDYSFRLEIPVSNIPQAPFVLELAGQIKPSEIYLRATVNADKVSVGLIGF